MEILTKVFNLLEMIVDRYGVKSIVAMGGIYAIYSLAVQSLATIPAVVGVVLIVLVYFLFRHYETFNKTRNE